jgi:hypothetical protein
MNHKSLFFLFILFSECRLITDDNPMHFKTIPVAIQIFNTSGNIPVPDGFKRISAQPGSFAAWLRAIKLKKDNHVYLYNGLLKRNQEAQFAVMDITIGKKDLQQCADAVMRLRAEYLFAAKKFNDITFTDSAGKEHKWKGKDNRKDFQNYLENVFGWCGTASLEKQLFPVINLKEIKPGDVFVKGGFPGHAMIVTDVAVNTEGKKIFMLAQSYMPAQDIHIVKNPMDEKLSPWYEVSDADIIVTPEWKFYKNQLKHW